MQRRAFSLFELVMVLAIVAVVAAIAAPRYNASLVRYRAESAAHRVRADLEYARSQARLVGVSRTVDFDVANDAYTLVGLEDPDTKTVPYTVSLGDEPYRAVITSAVFDDLATGSDLLDEVIFDGYGRADSGGTAVLTVGGETYQIDVNADTGEATVSRQ